MPSSRGEGFTRNTVKRLPPGAGRREVCRFFGLSADACARHLAVADEVFT